VQGCLRAERSISASVRSSPFVGPLSIPQRFEFLSVADWQVAPRFYHTQSTALYLARERMQQTRGKVTVHMTNAFSILFQSDPTSQSKAWLCDPNKLEAFQIDVSDKCLIAAFPDTLRFRPERRGGRRVLKGVSGQLGQQTRYEQNKRPRNWSLNSGLMVWLKSSRIGALNKHWLTAALRSCQGWLFGGLSINPRLLLSNSMLLAITGLLGSRV
jgi:hypothetical protein